MKFSEQVVLGSTLIKFQPWCFLEKGCGCLIGMAGAALGETDLGGETGALRIGELFPWLEKWRMVRCPYCHTTHYNYAASISCVAYHVQQDDWSFEQALSYIRSIEPPDVPEEPDAPDTVVPVWNRYRGVGV
jgi:hypothetical protein